MNCTRSCGALTPGLGRYDLDTNQIIIGDVGGNPPSAGVEASHKMFAPRLGLAYRLGDSTVIRAGYGISYDPLPMSRVFRDPFPLTVVQNFTGPNSYRSVRIVGAGIPSLTVPDLSTGTRAGPNDRCDQPQPVSRPAAPRIYSILELHARAPASGSMVATAAYVGTATTHQFVDHEMNAGISGQRHAGLPLISAKFGRTVSTLFEDGWLSSHYHSLQTTLSRRLQPGPA